MQVAILGGGGNMGMRISRTLQHRTEYTLRLIEPGEAGRVRIETLGLTAVDQETGSHRRGAAAGQRNQHALPGPGSRGGRQGPAA